jgi:integrase
MAGKPLNLEGLHFVRRRLASGKVRWHIYAWRSGPKIMEAGGLAKPSLTPDALADLVKAHESRTEPRRDNFDSLAVAYMSSPDFKKLSDYTRRDYRIWIDRARLEFGRASLRLFSDLRMRGTILEWRDKWAHAPRQAAYAMQVLSRILSWGVQRGWVMHNPAAGMPSVYKADRSDVVWENQEIDAVVDEMNAHVARAFKLAAWTGLSRGDLVALRWDEIEETHIERKRSKTGVEQVIPLFDETAALLTEFPKSAVTVVTNYRGAPFTPRGFAIAVERARSDANEKRKEGEKVAVGKTLHDLRGTFATRLMRRGFEDRDIDEIMGWETGKSARIRRRYISRKAVVISAIERMRQAPKRK